MTQWGLFDAAAGRAARDEAIDRVDANALPEWKDAAIETVYQVALRKWTFATDDIWAAGLEKPREPKAMGPVMLRAVKLGYCEPMDVSRRSRKVTQHARPLQMYRSLLCGVR